MQRGEALRQTHRIGLEDHQIGFQRRDGFDIGRGVIADFGLEARFGWVAAVSGDARHAIAEAERVQHLRDAGRGGDDPLRLRRTERRHRQA